MEKKTNQKSHHKFLVNLVRWTVLERIQLRLFHKDPVPSSLGLSKNIKQALSPKNHSVSKYLLLEEREAGRLEPPTISGS